MSLLLCGDSHNCLNADEAISYWICSGLFLLMRSRKTSIRKHALKVNSSKKFVWVFATAVLLGFAFCAKPFAVVFAVSGSDVTVAGQDLNRDFFSPDTAPSTANLLWKFQMTGPPGLYSTVVVGGIVYQGSLGTGDVYAINETTGTQIWHINLNNTQESLTYYNGLIYTQGGSLPYDTQLRSFGDLWVALMQLQVRQSGHTKSHRANG